MTHRTLSVLARLERFGRQAENTALVVLLGALVLLTLTGCEDPPFPKDPPMPEVPLLRWYVFAERSGAFAAAAQRCSQQSAGTYRGELVPLPADADQQREQLVRRLAA